MRASLGPGSLDPNLYKRSASGTLRPLIYPPEQDGPGRMYHLAYTSFAGTMYAEQGSPPLRAPDGRMWVGTWGDEGPPPTGDQGAPDNERARPSDKTPSTGQVG